MYTMVENKGTVVYKATAVVQYTIMDLLPVEYAVLLTRKSDIDRGEAEVNI